jgi:hypothetical protein
LANWSWCFLLTIRSPLVSKFWLLAQPTEYLSILLENA